MKASTFLVDKKLYSTPVKFVPVSVREDQSNAPQTVFKKTVYDGAFHTETSVTWRSCATDHKSPRQGNDPKEPLGKVTWYVQAFIRDMSVPASLATLCSDITEHSRRWSYVTWLLPCPRHNSFWNPHYYCDRYHEGSGQCSVPGRTLMERISYVQVFLRNASAPNVQVISCSAAT